MDVHTEPAIAAFELEPASVIVEAAAGVEIDFYIPGPAPPALHRKLEFLFDLIPDFHLAPYSGQPVSKL